MIYIQGLIHQNVINLPKKLAKKKFKEANELIELKGAKSIVNYTELKSAIHSFANYDTSIATDYIKQNSGATNIIVTNI